MTLDCGRRYLSARAVHLSWCSVLGRVTSSAAVEWRHFSYLIWLLAVYLRSTSLLLFFSFFSFSCLCLFFYRCFRFFRFVLFADDTRVSDCRPPAAVFPWNGNIFCVFECVFFLLSLPFRSHTGVAVLSYTNTKTTATVGFVVSFEAGWDHSVSIILYSIVFRIRAVCCDLVVIYGLPVDRRTARNDAGQAQGFCADGIAVVSFHVFPAHRWECPGTRYSTP